MILATFTKQPADVQDYDIDFTDYLAGLSDAGASADVSSDPGITIDSHVLSSGVVKVWVSGGTAGTYKITAALTTTGGRVKEAEIKIKVKEY